MSADNSGSRPAEEGLNELRKILLGNQGSHGDRIDRIEARLNTQRDFAADVGKVLPEAVMLRAQRDKSLTAALRGPVEEALQDSVRTNPQPLVDAIFPVIGPAIRKAVASSLRSIVQRFEKTLQFSLSPRAIAWRFDAWRTGRPFAEIVLLKTLAYRVEQVLLIHHETGLLLQQVVAQEVDSKDPELVSAMLTAIQDFVRDSFDAGEQDSLEAMRVGQFNVWIVRGRHSVLAAVIRGTAPADFRDVMRKSIELVEADMGRDMADFDGDAARYAVCRPYLEACLVKAKVKRRWSEFSRVVTFFGGLGIAFAVGLLIVQWKGRWQDWQEFLNRLEAEPGIVVTNAEKRDGLWHVSGLRDPLAKDPMVFLKGLDPSDVEGHWEGYQAVEPRFVLTRAQRLLAPPKAIRLTLQTRTLVAQGEASHGWLKDARRLAHGVAGIARFDTDQVIDTDRRAFDTKRTELEGRVVAVPHNAVSRIELKTTATALRTLVRLANAGGGPAPNRVAWPRRA